MIGLANPLGGITVLTDSKLVDGPFEDWSAVRSPGRAARRRRLGHPQRIRFYFTPSRRVLQFGSTIICHPAVYADIMALVPARPS